jgi:hypothetical protein
MKSIKIILLALMSFVISLSVSAQKKHGGGHHHHAHRHPAKKVVVVKRSPYRPHKVVVFHPIWHPKYACNRRWVYFPKYNIYWDNWRNHYRFWNGTIWLTQATAPPIIVNVNLEKEKHYELKEEEDDNDEINSANENHKSEYKPD